MVGIQKEGFRGESFGKLVLNEQKKGKKDNLSRIKRGKQEPITAVPPIFIYFLSVTHIYRFLPQSQYQLF